MSTVQKLLISAGVVILLGLGVVGAFAGLMVYGWTAATRAGNEAATIQNLKTIRAVEFEYFKAQKRNFGTLDQLVKDELLTSKFKGDPVIADGYVLRLTVKPPGGSAESSFIVTAEPEEGSGRRHFYLDSTSDLLRVNPDGPAGVNDPPLSK